MINPSQTISLVTLLGSILALVGVVFSLYMNNKIYIEQKKDDAVYIMIHYLISIYKGKYKARINNANLNYIFMNIKNDMLEVLRDIQDNVKKICNCKDDADKEKYEKVLKKEILFLIIYTREYYNLSEANISFDYKHGEIIHDFINSN